jgi:hypothetical protein
MLDDKRRAGCEDNATCGEAQMKRHTCLWALSLTLLAVSCGGSGAGTHGTGTSGTAGSSAGTAGASGSAGTSGTGAGGSSGSAGTTGGAGTTSSAGTTGAGGSVAANGTSVTGTADGTPFASIGSVFLIGNPDVALSTVVYIFSQPIKCTDISKAGWDTTITNMTQILELKMMGTTPAVYKPIIMAPNFPSAGQAQVNYAMSTTVGTPVESFSTSGSVTLSTIVANTSASGSFDLAFGANALKGTFSATYCAVGREP